MTDSPPVPLDVAAIGEVFVAVLAERRAQHALHGDQRALPDGTGPQYLEQANAAKAACDAAGKDLTWRHLVAEEILEAFAERDETLLRAELVQALALLVQWVAALNQRAGTPPAAEPAVERDRSVVDVYVILRRADGKILLLERAGDVYASGQLCPPSGHREAGETVVDGARRELWEEVQVTVEPGDLEFVHVVHHRSPEGGERIGFFFQATRWRGTPVNAEPAKCAGLLWLDPDDLPANTVPYSAVAIANIQAGRTFAVDGWTVPAN